MSVHLKHIYNNFEQTYERIQEIQQRKQEKRSGPPVSTQEAYRPPCSQSGWGCGQTDGWMDGQTRVKTLPSPILRMRSVITMRFNYIKTTIVIEDFSANIHHSALGPIHTE